MNQSVTVSAKSLDEAITKGCAELGVALDEVDFEVVDEGGMFRKMQVKVTVKNSAKETEPAPVQDTVQPEPAKTEPKVEVEAGTVEEFVIGGGKPKNAKTPKAPRKVTDFDPNCPKFAKTMAFAEEFFKLMGDNLAVVSSHTDDEFIISVSGDDVGRLIGKNGRTMAAINTIISAIAINTHCDEPRRVMVDIGNYREKRQEYLIDLAKRKAEQVKRTGRAVRLDPMPARERVVVHLTLQDVEGIITESEGVEPHRYLVIKPGAR
ncbi:MAG: KH domain-containing protein [Eubacteriales bacterium]|nr:KH domain-containing protein [Eubacteriales bacterium]